MDILICCRRTLNHEMERSVEEPLEIHLDDLNQVQSEHENAARQRQFFNAIQNVDMEEIESFVNVKGFEIKCAKESPSGKEAFHFLAEIEIDEITSKEDFKNIFKILLDAGCKINGTDRFGNTPLMLAAEKGNSVILELLLEKGADINMTNDYKNGPLHWASKNEKMEAINLLLLYKANVNAQNENYQTPLHLAVEQHKKKAVRRLIDEGADTNLKDLKTKTPLQYACDKSMENLFDEKLNRSPKDKKKRSSIRYDDDIDESDAKKYHEEYLALYEGFDLAKLDPSEAVKILSRNFKQKKHSMEDPPKDAVKKCRYFCRQYRKIGRKDIIKELRKLTAAGMTGPLAYSEHDLVCNDMNRSVRRDLTRSLCGEEKWKGLADQLGIPINRYAGYYDRKDDPAGAILQEVCDSRDLTVGELYNALVECNAAGLADQYL